MAIAGGGTAGHVLTGLAVAEALRSLDPPPEVLFVGTPHGLEGALVPPSGLPLLRIPGSPFAGQPWSGRARSLVDLARGARRARALLRQHRVVGVLGLGGYAAAGALLAAKSLGLFVAIHEANARPGLAHRRLGRLADRVYLGFPEAAPHFRGTSLLVTGTPPRPGPAFRPAPAHRPDGEGPHPVVVTGGSRGSPFLDRAVPPVLAAVARGGLRLQVLHLTGDGDPAAVRRRYAEHGVPARVETFVDDLAGILRRCDFAVTSAGARTLTETAAAGTASLIVPSAVVSGDHQTANARAFAERTGAWWTPEARWDPDAITRRIAALLGSGPLRELATKGLGSQVREDAAAVIASDCVHLLRRRT